MKREYTLLILGVLITSLEWIGLTTSFLQFVFTIIGLWVIYIAYKYRNEKMPSKIQAAKSKVLENSIPEPTPLTEVVENNFDTEHSETIINQDQKLINKDFNYERKQHIRPRI